MAPQKRQREDDMQTALTRAHHARVRPMLDLIDKLRNVGIERDIPIPQVAVVGDQSSGKSSVLEAMSGIPFPRGTGLVTRCPTQLIMKKTKADTVWKGTIGVRKTNVVENVTTLVDAAEIGKKIQELSNSLVSGTDSDFTTSTIVIEISSPDVPDLTVVDLPGIIRTKTGEQNERVIQEVDNLIEDYVKQERTIVLPVVPANVDVATVEVLEKAQWHDPAGVRTIGVVTKSDLVPEGGEEEVLAVMQNIRKPLKLGYVMVKNPGPKEMKEGISYTAAREMEQSFFRSHPVWKTLSKSVVLGIDRLTERLTEILVDRIAAQVPAMLGEMETQLKETNSRLEQMGKAPPTTVAEQRSEFVAHVFAFDKLLSPSLAGNYTTDPLSKDDNLKIRALARAIFLKFGSAVHGSRPQFDSADWKAMLKERIAASRGKELPGFLNANVFEQLVARQLAPWAELAETCLDDVVEVCKRTSKHLSGVSAGRFPGIESAFRTETVEVIGKLGEVTLVEVRKAFDREVLEIFTQNHYLLDTVNKIRNERFEKRVGEFLDGIAATLIPATRKKDAQGYDVQVNGQYVMIPAVKEVKMAPKALGEQMTRWYMEQFGDASNETQEAEDMAAFMQAYWKVASKRFVDTVPQIISTTLLDQLAKDTVQNLLSADHDLGPLFYTSEVDVVERFQLEEKKARLARAKELLLTLPVFKQPNTM